MCYIFLLSYELILYGIIGFIVCVWRFITMLFTVNTEVCTRCGLCVADCPTGLLVMTDDGPKTGKGGCISCGHCVAVCPTLALDSDLTPRAEQVDITKETKFTPEQAELFLRSRRSIRNYQNKPVPAELIRKVLNVARMAPTATNTQGISYIVIRDKQKLRRIADLVLEWMHIAAKTVPIMRLYARAAQAEVDKGKEYILRDAPALVVAIGSKKTFIALMIQGILVYLMLNYMHRQ